MKRYPMWDVMSKYGFDDSGIGCNYADKVAKMLRSYGYQATVVDAAGHNEYVYEVITPEGVNLGEERYWDPTIRRLIDKHFPVEIGLYEASWGMEAVEYKKEVKKCL